MSLSVSGVTPVFFTRSSQEEKLKRPSSTNWLLVSPMLDLEELDVLWSDSPRQSEAAESLGAGLLRRHRGDRLYIFETKRGEPEGRTWPLAGPMLAQPGGPAALAQLRQASWAR